MWRTAIVAAAAAGGENNVANRPISRHELLIAFALAATFPFEWQSKRRLRPTCQALGVVEDHNVVGWFAELHQAQKARLLFAQHPLVLVGEEAHAVGGQLPDELGCLVLDAGHQISRFEALTLIARYVDIALTDQTAAGACRFDIHLGSGLGRRRGGWVGGGI